MEGESTVALDFSYINDNGRKVSGAAALIHYIYTVKGGIENYNDEVGEQYIKAFISFNSEEINKLLQRNVNKSKFKVV